jgi:sugar (pentulose or hexulose) kinase
LGLRDLLLAAQRLGGGEVGEDLRGVDRERRAAGDRGHPPDELGPGSDGLVLVPYWKHVTSPYWDPAASGIVVGWHDGHRRAHLFRAIQEGIAYEHRLAMEGIQAATGVRIREHVILGAGPTAICGARSWPTYSGPP